jgi:hypothetical protein
MIYATSNVRGIIDKEEELDEVLKHRNIRTASLSKTKKKFQGYKDIRNYCILHSGVKT